MKPGKCEAKQPNERERKILFENLAVVVLCLLFALAMSVSLTAAQETETSEESPSDNSVWGAFGSATRMRAMILERRFKRP